MNKVSMIHAVLAGYLITSPWCANAGSKILLYEKKYLDPDVWQTVVTGDHCFAAAPKSLLEVEPIIENNKRVYKVQQYFDVDIERTIYAKPLDVQIKEHKIVGQKFCKGIVSISDRNLPFTKKNEINDPNDGVLLAEAMRQGINKINQHVKEMQLLAMNGSSGTYSSSQLGVLNQTFQAHLNEINRISYTARFSGYALFDGSNETILIPIKEGVSYEKVPLENLTIGSSGLNISSLNLLTSTDAQNAVDTLCVTARVSELLQTLKTKEKILKSLAKQEATVTFVDVRTDNFIVQRKKAEISQGSK